MSDALLDRACVERFIAAAADRLQGEWVLMGGSLAAVWLARERRTADLEFVDLAPSSEHRLALFDLLDELGLELTTVNPAAEYFLRRVPDWRAHLEVLRSGSAVIFQPDATLFLLLKLNRLSETDLGDCLGLLEHCRLNALVVDLARVRGALDALAATPDEGLSGRRDALRRALAGAGE
jgi:hypothetical protein